MKTKCLAFVATLAASLTFGAIAQAAQFDYASTVGSFIVFPGDGTFTFTPTTNNFQITSGTATGDFGEITGTYSIGAITNNSGVRSAPVTGTGTFVVHDGFGFDLTGTLVWVDITQSGTAGFLNINGTVNLTGI